MIITHKLQSMDLAHKQNTSRVDVVQDDKYSRDVEFTLTENGIAWQIPDGTTAIVRYKKPDGTGGNYDTLPDGSTAYQINGNVLTVALAPQVCTVPGKVQLSVGLIHGNAEINTFSVNIIVQPNPGSTYQSEDYIKLSGSVPNSGWTPNMYLGTDASGNVVAKEGTSGGGGTVSVDSTLTQSGQAADAKATGDAIRSLSEEIHAVDSALSDTSENPVQNKVIKSALDAKVGTEELNENSETLGTLTVKDSDGNVLGVYDGGSKEIVIPASTGGGGSHAWNLITNLSVSDAQDEHLITVDDSGNAFAYDEILVLYPSPAVKNYLYFRGGVTGAESKNCQIWLTAGRATMIQFSLMGGYVGISSVMRADGPVGFIQGLGGNATMDKIRTILIGAFGGFTAAGTIQIYGR